MPRSKEAAFPVSPPLPGFGPSIALLLSVGLPAKSIAELFGTTPSYVYVLAHRDRKSRSRGSVFRLEGNIIPFGGAPDDKQLVATKTGLGIRPEENGVEFTRGKAAKLSWLENRVDEIVSKGRSSYRFQEAARALEALKPYIGYPSETERLRVTAKLHQHLAWFYSHGGFSASSIEEATRSIRLYQVVYHNTADPDALRELGGSCLIRSNSCLMQGLTIQAQETIDFGIGATHAAGVALNSEFYQQSGVALFQTRRDDDAAKEMFRRATETTPDTDVKNKAMTLRMASDRFLNLIAAPFPRMDDELILLNDARGVYGKDSLETIMCRHWGAACGLSTDSPSANLLALELIEQNKDKLTAYGHQATISKLLPIALDLPQHKRPMWIRFALYQNAFRNN